MRACKLRFFIIFISLIEIKNRNSPNQISMLILNKDNEMKSHQIIVVLIAYTLIISVCANDGGKDHEPTIYQIDSVKNVQAVDDLMQMDSLRLSE